jgi:hypothetical protein
VRRWTLATLMSALASCQRLNTAVSVVSAVGVAHADHQVGATHELLKPAVAHTPSVVLVPLDSESTMRFPWLGVLDVAVDARLQGGIPALLRPEQR